MREREAKLIVGDSFELPDLTESLERATFGPAVEWVADDVYHDTADLRLLRWGCTLRHRKAHGWTVKLPAVGKRVGVGTDERDDLDGHAESFGEDLGDDGIRALADIDRALVEGERAIGPDAGADRGRVRDRGIAAAVPAGRDADAAPDGTVLGVD